MSKSIFIMILLTICLCSCRNDSKPVVLNPVKELPGDVNLLVADIASTNRLMGPAVGVAGSKPRQWDNFEQLKKLATDSQLVELTNNPNAVVRCYAFAAVLERSHIDPFPILIKHLSDTANVATLYGCIGGNESAGNIFFRYVNPPPEDSTGYRLNKLQRQIVDSVFESRRHENFR